MKTQQLPFTIGQSVEEKSFIRGFRGAWFLSKIKDINYKIGKCVMEYPDYPDTKPKWIELYKKPPHLRKKSDRELMIRPSYPRICGPNDMCSDVDNSGYAVVVKSDWQLGDLVDWLHNCCWWSGNIIELLLTDGKARVEFPPPPLGEGTVEEVFLKDIRPSLNWSPASGWTVPTQNSSRACAQLIGPIYPVPVKDGTQNCVEETEMLTESSLKPSLSSPLSSSLEQKVVKITTDTQKELLENTVSTPLSSSLEQKIVKITTGAQKELLMNTFPKKHAEFNRTDASSGSTVKQRGVALNSTVQVDPAVAAVWDLEECLRKVKWLKTILQAGDSIPDDDPRPKWEYVPR